ncbi:hypothetical protein N9L76_06315 [bacterium]|nr:hypothetical protein [bacterium]
MDDSFDEDHGDPPLTPRERELPRDNLGVGEGYLTVRRVLICSGICEI